MVGMEMWAETPVSMVYPSIQSKYSAHKSYQILHSFKDLHVAPLLATEIKKLDCCIFLNVSKDVTSESEIFAPCILFCNMLLYLFTKCGQCKILCQFNFSVCNYILQLPASTR